MTAIMDELKNLAVIRDCASLASGTIATLTGHNRYEDIDQVQEELVRLAETMPEAGSWMEVWTEYRRRHEQ